LWEDYFSGRYAAAAGAMRGFYRSLERMLSNVSELKYTLGRRLGALEKGEPLFPDAHLAYAPAAGQWGPSLLEILAAAADARKIIDGVRTRPLPERIVGRIAEDERAFAYAERTMLFYDALCRAKMAVDEGAAKAAASALDEARALAELLKADLSAARMGGTHSNAPNALDASYAAPALEVLAKRIAGLAATGKQPEAPFYADKTALLTYLAADGKTRTIRTPEDWKIRRRHILGNFEKVAGPYPGAAKRVPLDVRIEGEEDLGGVVRKKLTYAAEPGDRVPAYLLVPKGLRGRAPAVLCPHQTNPRGKEEPAGIPGGNPDMAIALELARRGYVTLAPDYPGFGEYRIDVYAMGYASATMKGIWNHVRAVDLLQSLPEVDPDRIGCAGHSLGGHNSIFAALYDPRIRAVVTSCGFTAFPKYYGGDLTGWSHKGYMPRIASVYGKDPARMPFDFPELLAALAPRPVFINAPLRDANFEVSGVDDCVRAGRPVFALLGARDALTILHPDLEHAFPSAEREAAWDFFDRVLRRR
jgi:dienelactone hydrolase